MIYNLKNELGKTYLIAGIDFEIKDDYRLKMITENVIDGLTPINIRQIDGEKRAYYDVTDKTSLSRFLAHNDPDYNEIRLLIGSILKVSKVGCEYLLEESCISFEPDTIYKNNLTGDYEFLYLPKKISYEEGPREDLLNLMNELIMHIPSDDNDAVKAGYAMYELAASENVSMASLYEAVDNIKTVTETFSEDEFSFEDYFEESSTEHEKPTSKHKRPLMIKEGICFIFASTGIVFIGMWLYYGYFAM